MESSQAKEKRSIGTTKLGLEEGELLRRRGKCALCLWPGAPGFGGAEVLDASS